MDCVVSIYCTRLKVKKLGIILTNLVNLGEYIKFKVKLNPLGNCNEM